MKREVKEGAELVADDAHEGLRVGRIHQPVREDSVGREWAEPWECRGQGPAAGAGHQAREARVWRLSGASHLKHSWIQSRVMLDLVSWKSLLALSMPWNTCGRGVAGESRRPLQAGEGRGEAAL